MGVLETLNLVAQGISYNLAPGFNTPLTISLAKILKMDTEMVVICRTKEFGLKAEV